MEVEDFVELTCGVQNYVWGRPGLESLVARLAAAGGHLDSVDPAKPYAELWAGTHPGSPSYANVNSTRVLLQEYLGQNYAALGVPESGALPFLAKVLSVARALSIQSHPDLANAARLHKLQPNVYKDSNHKPEMAIALSRFEALVGFRQPAHIAASLAVYPELKEIVGQQVCLDFIDASANAAAYPEHLKHIVTKLLRAPEEQIKSQLEKLVERLNLKRALAQDLLQDPTADLVLRLHAEYPGDVGCFFGILLNRFVLEPGQAVYLPPNTLHAYLSGDCLEAMASSDNVVRAGLTPKHKDVDTILETVDFRARDTFLLAPEPDAKGTRKYEPVSFDDVCVVSATASETCSPAFSAIDKISVIVVTKGTGSLSSERTKQRKVAEGSVVLCPPKTKVAVASSAPGQTIHVYQVYSPKG